LIIKGASDRFSTIVFAERIGLGLVEPGLRLGPMRAMEMWEAFHYCEVFEVQPVVIK